MSIGIVVALPEELRTLTAEKIDKGDCFAPNEDLLIAHSGAGPDNAERASELLVNRGATRLISWGCAAGLSAWVKPGDLILANQLVDADGNEIANDAGWRSRCSQILQEHGGIEVKNGTIAESRRLVVTSLEKHQQHLASGAVALDMESAAVARVAGRHQLAFLAIRAIADPAAMDLPAAIAFALSDQGDVDLGKLLKYLLLHQLELPSLIKVGLHFHKARHTLIRTAGQLESIIDF